MTDDEQQPGAEPPEPATSEPDPAQPGWAAPPPPAPWPAPSTGPGPSSPWNQPQPPTGGWPPAPPTGGWPQQPTGQGWEVPAGQGWPTPPPPKKRKLTWLWIVLGAIGVLVVVLVVVIVVFVSRVKAPIDATNQVLREVKAGSYASAYNDSCQRNRDDFTQEEYRAAWESEIESRGRIVDFNVSFATIHGNRARVQYTIDFRDSASRRFGADVLREAGRWRPCLLTAR